MLKKKSLFLSLMPFLLASCGDVKSTKYQDTSHLETPPRMKMSARPKTQKQKQSVRDKKVTGLGDIVTLAGTKQKPVIKIKKLFDRSWNIVDQALQTSDIQVKDKNRELGVFYIIFDPDTVGGDDSEMVDKLTFFLFKNEYEEAAYKLRVQWKDSDTEISAELVDESDIEEADDEFGGGAFDSGAKLINKLYKTIKDDLPLN